MLLVLLVNTKLSPDHSFTTLHPQNDFTACTRHWKQ